MIPFGKTLREAREAKGYSVSQLAEITHILSNIIDQLEREDFSKIVAPIYGRGFVKIYCETVGLDAKPLVEAFMELYNLQLDDDKPSPAPRPIAPKAPPGAEPRVEPEAGPKAEEEPARAPELPLDGPGDPFAADDPPKRDYRLPTYAVSDVPSSFWRFGVLIVAAILVIAGIVFAFRAVYRATMTVPGECDNATPARACETTPDATVPRQPGSVPPLYID